MAKHSCFSFREHFSFRSLNWFILAVWIFLFPIRENVSAIDLTRIPQSAVAFIMNSRSLLSTNPEADAQAISSLLSLHTSAASEEIFWAVLMRLDLELQKADGKTVKFTNKISSIVLEAGIQVLAKVGHQGHLRYLRELRSKCDELLLNDPSRVQTRGNYYLDRVVPLFRAAEIAIESRAPNAALETNLLIQNGAFLTPRSDALIFRPSSEGVDAQTVAASTDPLAEVRARIVAAGRRTLEDPTQGESGPFTPDELPSFENLQAYLESHVDGQPEIIERLMMKARVNKIFANKQVPGVVVVMGPGHLGGGTAVRAYVEALNGGDSRASKDHLYELPIADGDAAFGKIEGSEAGTQNSDSLSPFVRWLVKHSGGKYQIMPARGNSSPYVVENKEWKPGTVLPGYFSPRKAVISIENFELWSKANKDHFLLNAIGNGRFRINNPGSGIDSLELPIDIVIRTEDGADLLNVRHGDGSHVGQEQTYESMLFKWQESAPDKKELRSVLGEGINRLETTRGHERGTSPQLLDLFQDGDLLLLRPLSESNIEAIVHRRLDAFKAKFKELNSGLQLEVDATVHRFLLTNGRVATDFASGIDQDIQTYLEDPFLIWTAKAEEEFRQAKRVRISIECNGECELVLNVDGKTSRAPIAATRRGLIREMPKAELQRLLGLNGRISKSVFGVNHFSEELSDAMMVLRRAHFQMAGSHRASKARTFVLLGPSSVGKTELARTLATELYGSEAAALLLNFNQIHSVADLRRAILGTPDEVSEFAIAHKQTKGRLLLILDELVNDHTPPHILEALYDLFREPRLRMANGKVLDMSFVTLMPTGNIGADWYKDIPQNLRFEEQMAAMHAIYKKMTSSQSARRAYLESRLPGPLLTRLGEENIFFFSPLSYESIRRLSILKLNRALEALAPQPQSSGWKIQFASLRDYEAMIETIDRDGFKLSEQGASIDHFVNVNIREKLEALLMKNDVPVNSEVVLHFEERREPIENPGLVRFRAEIPSGQKFELTLNLEPRRPTPRQSRESQISTAAHEAAHFLGTLLFFRDYIKSEKVSIIRGVTEIGGRPLVYEGIHEASVTKSWDECRQTIIRRIAKLVMGGLAEVLITQRSQHNAGKSSDLEEATRLARLAVLKYGLSNLGWEAMTPNQDLDSYVASFSPEKLRRYEAEVQSLLEEGRKLGLQALVVNFDNILIPFARLLAEKGELGPEEIADFVASVKPKTKMEDGDRRRYSEVMGILEDSAPRPQEFDFLHHYMAELKVVPALISEVSNFKLADINQLLADRRREELQRVPLNREELPIVKEACLGTLAAIGKAA